jgi:hypothetical protein
MRARKDYISKYVDKRLKRSNLIIRAAILIMMLVVLYDSIVFNIPLYYILFLAAGMLIGRIFFISHRIEFDENEVQLKLRTNNWSILFLLLLLAGRFIIGPYILKAFHFVWVSDALLLFFVGIYSSKWQVIIKQIDDIFYRLLPIK